MYLFEFQYILLHLNVVAAYSYSLPGRHDTGKAQSSTYPITYPYRFLCPTHLSAFTLETLTCRVSAWAMSCFLLLSIVTMVLLVLRMHFRVLRIIRTFQFAPLNSHSSIRIIQFAQHITMTLVVMTIDFSTMERSKEDTLRSCKYSANVGWLMESWND